ncbi:MAG: alpha/beta hydrolase [Anaerolineaceae bacterium]|nr:alpha/beta hydrolase [Anaerolineaceae bacterium]
MEQPKLSEKISVQMVKTARLEMNVLTCGDKNGIPVVFIHGNFSSALYWEEMMLSLPKGFWGIAYDMRGYGWSEDKPIDGTKGMQDWSDDLEALLDTLKLDKVHLIGWSMGGGVMNRFVVDHGERILSVTMVAPISPYGFGGTKDLEGTPCSDDFAGSGGGTVNPDFIQRIKDGDRSEDDPNSPRNIINTFYFKAPFRAKNEDDLLTAALQEKMGDDRYPGDFVPSDYWPSVAPGKWGPINAGSPKFVTSDVEKFIKAPIKPPILWIRGAEDLIVGDNSMFDFGALGKLGYVPGWPGDDIFPPQPMVGQMRAVLQKYAAQGGLFEEHIVEDAAHAVFIEKPEEFNNIFHAFLVKH